MSSGKLLSAVVIGRNEGERLGRCLASVQAMRRDGWDLELIYVDSGSSDGSVALAESMGALTIALHPARPTAALGRNAGWRAASGEIVLFLDGDTVLAEDFAADSIAEFEDPRIAIVWGHRRETHPERSIYNLVLNLDWMYPPGLTAMCGGDALFRREVLIETGGFDDTLIAGEEPELCRRITAGGYLIRHVDRPMTGHDLAITSFGQYWKRAIRAGHAYAEVAQRFAASPAPFWSDEVQRNYVRAAALLTLLLAAILASGVLRSWLPFAGAIAILAALAVRSAWKARWKSGSVGTLLLYGIHSHFQQLPIFCGQIKFGWNRRRGLRSELVEYKQP